jgi:DNA-binding NarL/FixJ family response regulator
MTAPTIGRLRLALPAPLTVRQEVIAQLLSDGLGMNAIAKHLHISRATVDTHLVDACKKIPGDLPRSTRLVLWWRGAGLELLQPLPGASLRKAMAEASVARKPTKAGGRK